MGTQVLFPTADMSHTCLLIRKLFWTGWPRRLQEEGTDYRREDNPNIWLRSWWAGFADTVVNDLSRSLLLILDQVLIFNQMTLGIK